MNKFLGIASSFNLSFANKYRKMSFFYGSKYGKFVKMCINIFSRNRFSKNIALRINHEFIQRVTAAHMAGRTRNAKYEQEHAMDRAHWCPR